MKKGYCCIVNGNDWDGFMSHIVRNHISFIDTKLLTRLQSYLNIVQNAKLTATKLLL